MPSIFLHIPANNITVRQELRANAYAEVRVSHCRVSDVQCTLQRSKIKRTFPTPAVKRVSKSRPLIFALFFSFKCVLSPFSSYFQMTISPNKVKKDAREEHRWAVEKNR